MEGIARAGGKRLPAGHQHSLGDSDLLIILWHYHLSVPIFFQEMPDKNRKNKRKKRPGGRGTTKFGRGSSGEKDGLEGRVHEDK